ncbi:MAG: hypothetical protein QNJ98_15890 [Planctomycetota bacterium]|nr:hypothetical protein [Planctomycetota bacterium]
MSVLNELESGIEHALRTLPDAAGRGVEQAWSADGFHLLETRFEPPDVLRGIGYVWQVHSQRVVPLWVGVRLPTGSVPVLDVRLGPQQSEVGPEELERLWRRGRFPTPREGDSAGLAVRIELA